MVKNYFNYSFNVKKLNNIIDPIIYHIFKTKKYFFKKTIIIIINY